MFGKHFSFACGLVVACLTFGSGAHAQNKTDAPVQVDAEEMEFTASVWADNWFALYVNGKLVGEDSVPFNTIRSFNSDTITFRASYPLTIAVITRDYIENDSGLEYIGSLFGLMRLWDGFTFFQQMGDGGFIAQIAESDSGKIVAVTSGEWQGLLTHKAPLNPECEKSSQPVDDCQFMKTDHPVDWQSEEFDSSSWDSATEYTEQEIGAKFGYNDVEWDPSAKLIWTGDLKADNTILWRYKVAP